MLECAGVDSKPSNSFLDDVCVMWAMVKQGLQKTKDVRAFYKSQGSLRRLPRGAAPRRDLLMQHAVPWVKKPKTWISVGCGTARDVEFVTGHVKAAGTKVYLVDLSGALLDRRARVLELGLQRGWCWWRTSGFPRCARSCPRRRTS